MRSPSFAPVLAGLAAAALGACGGPADALTQIAPCPTCGVGHLRSGVTGGADVAFGAGGTAVSAMRRADVDWLGPTYAAAASASADAPGDYGGSLALIQAVRAPDGHAFLLLEGSINDGFGPTITLVAQDAGGGERWRQTLVSDHPASTLQLALAASGDLLVFAAGAPVTLDGHAYGNGVTIAALAADTGHLRWARSGGASVGRGGGVAALAGGDLVVTGAMPGLDLGGAVGVVPAKGVVVARLTAAGDGVWARVLTGRDFTTAGALAVGDGDRVYAQAQFGGTIDLGDGTVLAPPPEDVDAHDLVLALDGAGATQWTTTPSFTTVRSLAASPRGVLFGSMYDSPRQIGGALLPAPQTMDGACGELVAGHAAWTLVATGPSYQGCDPVGTYGGRSYVAVEAFAAQGAAVDTTFDGVHVGGAMALLGEVATAP